MLCILHFVFDGASEGRQIEDGLSILYMVGNSALEMSALLIVQTTAATHMPGLISHFALLLATTSSFMMFAIKYT